MAKTNNTKNEKAPAVPQYGSEIGKAGMIKTSIYQTNPRTVIEVIGALDDETNVGLRLAVDAFLKAKGY